MLSFSLLRFLRPACLTMEPFDVTFTHPNILLIFFPVFKTLQLLLIVAKDEATEESRSANVHLQTRRFSSIKFQSSFRKPKGTTNRVSGNQKPPRSQQNPNQLYELVWVLLIVRTENALLSFSILRFIKTSLVNYGTIRR